MTANENNYRTILRKTAESGTTESGVTEPRDI